MNRYRLELEGRLQGIGFRPFVCRLARELGISGWVRNTGQGVSLELQGEEPVLAAFELRLASELPVAGFLRGREKRAVPLLAETGFEIQVMGQPMWRSGNWRSLR